MLGGGLDIAGAALDGLPVPISTPGFDNAPYLSAGHYITKDPESAGRMSATIGVNSKPRGGSG